MLALLKDRDTPAGVLAWGLANRTEKELREAALQNPSTPDEAIEALAAELPENLAELVVINQVRLLRRTSLLVALEGNPDLSADQRRRLRELRESFHIGEKPVEAPPPPPPPPAAEPCPPRRRRSRSPRARCPRKRRWCATSPRRSGSTRRR